MSEVQVIIPTYNRVNLIFKCLNSVLEQTFDDYNIIISDNSTNSETEILFKKYTNSKVVYKKRKQHLSGIEHLNLIISEVSSKYFIIFHDDDIMHPRMIENLLCFLKQNNGIAAVGCNAKLQKNKMCYYRKFGKFKNNIIINNPIELVDSYVETKKFVPFPSYLYNYELVRDLKLNIQNGGKYSDLAFLVDILKTGKIAFLGEILMTYFIHKGQDTSNHKFLEKILLIKYLVTIKGLNHNHNLIKKLRVENIYMELKTTILSANSISINQYKYFKKQKFLILKYLGIISYIKINYYHYIYNSNK